LSRKDERLKRKRRSVSSFTTGRRYRLVSLGGEVPCQSYKETIQIYVEPSVKIALNPKRNELLDEDKQPKIAMRKMNNLTCSELILSIDTTESAGKAAFSTVKGLKSGDFKDGNANMAW
jgi:hypothetical protein